MSKINTIEWSAKALDIRVIFCTRDEIGFTNIGYQAILPENPDVELMEQHLIQADKQGQYQVIFFCNDYGDLDIELPNNVISLSDRRFKKLTKK